MLVKFEVNTANTAILALTPSMRAPFALSAGGAGDRVIDQSFDLMLSSLGLEGDTDLQALARYDDNGDGKLDAQDAIWTELKVWQDLNQDGKTEGDGTELKTLAAWGISSINLAYDDGTDFTDESNDVEVFGNILHGLAVAVAA